MFRDARNKALLFVINAILSTTDRVLDYFDPLEEMDFGKHNVLIRRDGGAMTPMTDEDMWGMLDSDDLWNKMCGAGRGSEDLFDRLDDVYNDLDEDFWVRAFADGERLHGPGVLANN